MMMMGGGLISLILIGLLVVYVAGGLRGLGGGARRELPQGESGRTALDVLKERYVRGEISREEYEAIRRDLES